MANALICTVGTTLDAKNDIVDALADEIRTLSPDAVVFLASSESHPNAERVAELSKLPAAKWHVVELASPHNLNEIFEKTNVAIRELQAAGFSPRDISINYTSGTKVMGSGAVLSAVFHQCQELRYIYEGNGSESAIITTHPSAVFAFRDLLLARRLVEEMRFQSARDLLARTDSSLLSEVDVERVNALRNVAIAYSAWDSFKIEEFLRTISQVSRELDFTHEFLLSDEELGLVKHLAADLRSSQYSPRVFADVMNNAVRRMLEGKFDDAIARVYRAMEMLAKWVLQRYDVDTDNLDTRRVPPRHRVSYEAMRSPDDGSIRVGMRKSFELLTLLEAPLGARFAEEPELMHMLQRRAQSILAHGTHPIEEAECKKLYSAANDLLEGEIQEFAQITRALQFPWLRKAENA